MASTIPLLTIFNDVRRTDASRTIWYPRSPVYEMK
jgi:hypothetical protein